MNLIIKKVNENNYKEIVNLKVAKGQENYIETVEACLEEAKEYSVWNPVGIYDKEKPVGFAMYGLFLEEGDNGRVWLDRFLISAENQGMGYGKTAVKFLIDHLYKGYGYDEVYLSVYEDNKNAINLYKELGFKFNGEDDVNGEKVMVINFKSKVDNNEQ
ncbi:GNAT family N-acetyltransferase [Clostridium sp. D53t1_180928_C8]|uniref:GNAT family N-acetyltransferase n=1 Tax=Clostridium sp. D53t1_180928_C8 TaxID=2787101 RepID=UPI0018AA2ECD|nr:GNAT family N-acetyltransferase [Clostridium sp. D53t1_180928_C8]